ncbi:EF-hand calcium-binding domain-containing protein 13-like [Thomomys bottae]
MESRTHFFSKVFQKTEETTNSSDNEASSFAPPKSNESKKYIKMSRTIEKRTSPRTMDLSPDTTREYGTSVFLSREENSFDFSGGKTVRRKKSLQVHLHSRRSELGVGIQREDALRIPKLEIASPPLKPSKETTRKESTSCKLPDQLGAPKPSLPPRKYSSSTRKKESLSNLYMTLYEEIPEGNIVKEDLNALHKACKIFGKVRGGKIYVNDLSVVLNTLKISMSDSEIRRALKMIDIDVNGMLEFSSFLKTVNSVSSLVSQDLAFQNALKTFSKIKGGRVSTDEVDTVLDSLEILRSPETVQEVLKYVYTDRNETVDIGDVIFTLSELQQQYEDVSTMEDLGSNETSLNRTLSYIAPHKKKSSLSRPSESSLLQKLEKRSFQSFSNVLERDNSEYKESKVSLQPRKFSDVVDSSHIRAQESYSKNGTDLKISEDEPPDSKSKPQSLQSSTSLFKFLDKSDTTNIRKPQKSTGKRRSTFLKQISSKEKPAVNTLDNISQPINKLQKNYISIEELQSILPSLGITLLDTESQRILKQTTNENGLVNLDDFITTLSKEQNLHEYDVLTNLINGVEKIEDGKVDCKDINTCLEDFGIYLSKPEVEELVELTEVDEAEKVNFKQFIDTLMNNTDFSEKSKLPDATENLQNLTQDQMSVNVLWSILSTLNSNLKKEKFLDILKLAKVDDDKVQLKEFEKAVKNMHDASRLKNDKVQLKEFEKAIKSMHDPSKLKNLQEIALALDSLDGDMIAEKNLEDFLKNIGIKSPKEAERILQSDFVSEGNMVNVNDSLKSLKDTQKFSNFIALNEIIDILDHMEDSYPSDKDKYSDKVEDTYFTDDTLQEIINDLEDFSNEALSSNPKLPAVNEIKEAANIFSHVDNKRIAIPKLEHALKCLNLSLMEEDFNEILKHCNTNDNREVDLQDFLTETKKSPNFKNCEATELLLAITQILQNDLVDISELKMLLLNDGLDSTNVVLTEMLRNIPEYEYGKITIHEIMTKFAEALTIPKAPDDKNKVYNVNIHKSDPKAASYIQQNLNAIGIDLTDEETQKVLDNTNPNDEVVLFKDVIRELANTDDFMECQRIEDAWNIVNTISDGKVEVKELLSTLKNIFNTVSDGKVEVKELLFTLKNIFNTVSDGKVEGKELLSTLKNIVNKVSDGKIEVKELLSTLKNIVNNVPDGKVEIKELLSILKNLEKPLNEDQHEVLLSSAINGLLKEKTIALDKMPEIKLNSKLLGAGIPISEKTSQESLRNASIKENDEISVKQILENLDKSKPAPVLEDVQELSKALDKVTKGKVDTADVRPILKGLKVSPPEEELQNSIPVDTKAETDLKPLADTGEVTSEVDFSDLENVIKNMGIELTPREPLELEKLLRIDANGKIDTNKLMSCVETIRGSQVDIHDIDSFLGNMALKFTMTEPSDLSSDLVVDERGKIDTSGMKKVPEIMEIEPEDKDPWKMVKDQLMNGQKIDVNNLDSILGRMEIKLSEEEIEMQTENLQTEEKTDYKLTGAVKVESGEEVDVSDGKELLPRGSQDLMKNVSVEWKKVGVHDIENAMLEHTDQEGLKEMKGLPNEGGAVDINEVGTLLQNMGTNLSEEEISNLMQNLLFDGHGKIEIENLLDGIKAFIGVLANIKKIDCLLNLATFALHDFI